MQRVATRRLAAVIAALLTLGLAAISPVARAANPSAGTLTNVGDRVTWSGGPFVQSNPTDPSMSPTFCTGAVQPGCDHYTLHVAPQASPSTLVVDLTPSSARDDYDLYVYGPDGQVAGESATSPVDNPAGTENVAIALPAPGDYDVVVNAYGVVPGGTYSAAATLKAGGTKAYENEDAVDCLEAVPDKAGVAGVTDDGRRIALDVTVLVDDTVTLQRAKEVFAYAKRSYDPLKIDLEVTRYLPVSLPSDGTIERQDGKTVGRSTGENAIAYAKQVMGGVRPPDSDVVYLLTDKDLYTDEGTSATGATDLLGQADCLGGVRFDQHAFAVGELGDSLAYSTGPVSFLGNAGSKTASHEIGHLLGAQHHYFDCVEGLETETTDGEVSPCTIMAPLVDLGSINFGVLDGAVVRGHAVSYAGGNDALAARNRAEAAAQQSDAFSMEGGGEGYALLGEDGGIFTFGSATFHGSTGDRKLNQPVVGMAWTRSGGGYWIVARDGGIFTFGDASFYGSTGGMKLNAPILGMESTPSGRGYWLVAADGGIFTFGDAGFFGSTGDRKLNAPVVGLATTSTGRGYWLVASDGGIFTFGDAPFHGSTGDRKLNQPVFDLAHTLDDGGYWLVARDGGIFTFGNAPFHGSSAGTTSSPVVGMTPTGTDGGYWIATRNGGVASFGDAPALGNLSGQRLNAPIVGFAGLGRR